NWELPFASLHFLNAGALLLNFFLANHLLEEKSGQKDFPPACLARGLRREAMSSMLFQRAAPSPKRRVNRLVASEPCHATVGNERETGRNRPLHRLPDRKQKYLFRSA